MHGPNLYIMMALTALTIAIVIFFPRITKAIPSSLVAIAVVFAIVMLLGIDTKQVVDIASVSGSLPSFSIPNVPIDIETLKIIFPNAIVMERVGLIETLLTLNMTEIHNKKQTKPRQKEDKRQKAKKTKELT